MLVDPLGDLVVSCQVLAWFLALRFALGKCRMHANLVSKIVSKIKKTDSKIDKNDPWERLGELLETGRPWVAEKGVPSSRNGGHFGAIWPILGAFWSPAGRQGAPKIHHFGIKAPQKSEK